MFFNYEYTKLMEDDLDKIANGNLIWHNLCENCYSNLTSETNKLQDLKKFSIIFVFFLYFFTYIF